MNHFYFPSFWANVSSPLLFPFCLFKDAGELYVWGSNKHEQLASQAAFLLLPQRIEARCFQNEKIAAVWSGLTHLVAQTGERAAGNLWLGSAAGGQLSK